MRETYSGWAIQGTRPDGTKWFACGTTGPVAVWSKHDRKSAVANMKELREHLTSKLRVVRVTVEVQEQE